MNLYQENTFKFGELATVNDPPSWAVLNGQKIYVTQDFLDEHADWSVVYQYTDDGFEVYEIVP